MDTNPPPRQSYPRSLDGVVPSTTLNPHTHTHTPLNKSSSSFQHSESGQPLPSSPPHRFRWPKRSLLLCLAVTIVAVLFAGSVYAAINLNAPSSPNHTKTNSAINIDSAEAGLVGEWKLNGNAKDSTPYSDNGTVTGATPTTGPQGQANGAYAFNGSSYINIPNSSAFTIGSGGFTYSAWVYPTTLNTSFNMITGHFLPYLAIYSTGGGTGRLYMSLEAGGTQHAVEGATTLTTNHWYYVTATYDSSGYMRVYVNGTLDGTAGPFTSITNYSTDNQYIGQYSSAGTYRFTGSIADVRIYNQALTASQIANLYQAGSSQINLDSGGTNNPAQSINLTQGLVGYWPFTGNAKDQTPYSDNWTLSGQTYGTNRFGTANASIAFPAGSITTMTGGTNAALSSANAISVNIWLKLNSFGTYYAVHPVGKWQDGVTTNANYALYVFGDYEGNNDQGQVAFYAIRGGTWNAVSATTYRISTGTWYMITLTYTAASGGQLYINGQAAGGLTGSGALATNTYPLVSDFQDGNIADLSIYNRALSAAEVLALYSED